MSARTWHVGRDAIGAELAKYFSLGLQMSITQRHLFVADDIASLILDWSYVGIARDGAEINMVATATDIARRWVLTRNQDRPPPRGSGGDRPWG